jgi:outer membrane protein TolC/ABC-type uncharacterized transport system substrate-binding protein
MKLYLKSIIALGMLICFTLTCNSQDFNKDDKIRIGFIIDGEREGFLELIDEIQNEIDALLKNKYKKIKFPEDKLIISDWTIQGIKKDLDNLLADEEVDIIVGIGTLVSIISTQKAPFEKPVIVVGIINPTFQKIPLTEENTSGVKNFTYTTLPFSPERDLEIFQSIFPFGNIGILLSEEIIKTIPLSEKIEDYFNPAAQKLNTKFQVFAISSDFDNDINNLPDDIDAVYIGTFFNLSKLQIEKLINMINKKKWPSFALGGRSFVEAGALASVSADDVMSRQSRRIALNIEKILEGENPGNIAVLLNYKENLVLNMKTMQKIGFYPRWNILTDSEVIQEDDIEEGEILDIYKVINQALLLNYDLKIAEKEVLVNEKEINIARSDLLPQLDVYANGVLIDKKVAENSIGNQAERSAYTGADFNQLLYSDRALANVYIQKKLQENQEYVYDQVELDIVLEAATTYLNVLQAITLESIFNENLNISRKNLEIARLRQETGYLSPSDVYRWESEIASARMDVIEAGSNREQAEFALKRIINMPLKEYIITRDIGLDDTIINLNHERIKKYFDNPAKYLVFRDFFIEDALRDLPEIKQIDAAIAAQERFLTTNKRGHYLPYVGLQANMKYNFYRGGAGAEIEPIEIPGIGTFEFIREPKKFQWNMGISMVQPISQGGKMNAQTQQARIELTRLQEQKYNITQKLTQQVLSAFSQISSSHPNIRLSRKAAEAADKNFELVQDAYSQGMTSIIQLLDAQNAAISARFYAVNAVYQYMIDGLYVQRAIGKYFVMRTGEEIKDFFTRLDQYMATH